MKLINLLFIFILFIEGESNEKSSISSYLCNKISLPLISHFIGLEPPTNQTKWNIALDTVCRGELVLLRRVHERIKTAEDIYAPDRFFRWNHHLSDILLHKDDKINDELTKFSENRAPIVHFGRRFFQRPNFKGDLTDWKGYGPEKFFDFKGKFSKKFIGIGAMDENWGWLSSNILNRTVSWGLLQNRNPSQALKNFIEDPNLLFLIVNQHHNFSHPKIVSMPIGVTAPAQIFNIGQRILNRDNLLKEHQNNPSEFSEHGVPRKVGLLINGGSDYGARPAIRECVGRKMGSEMETLTRKISQTSFFLKVSRSVAVLCMPGLGYDTYRLSETLLLGTMPVIERGVGLDRTVYKLPVVVVDDFADLTPEIIHQAYVEAVYREDEWEYERLTLPFWKNMIKQASESQSSDIFYHHFPLKSVLKNFIRPLFPFDCTSMGGCGSDVVSRVPKEYCAIDIHRDWRTFDIMSNS